VGPPSAPIMGRGWIPFGRRFPAFLPEARWNGASQFERCALEVVVSTTFPSMYSLPVTVAHRCAAMTDFPDPGDPRTFSPPLEGGPAWPN